MQTLGLSDSTPKPESRLKALFWPRIRHEYDADYIAQQGLWLCWILAGLTLAIGLVVSRSALVLIDAAYLLLGGVGVRQGSRFAAIVVFVNYSIMVAVTGPGVMSVIFLGLLLSNVRGTWLAAKWRLNATEPPPIPMEVTFLDRVSNRLPARIWPTGRWLFYPLAVMEGSALIWTLVNRAA